MTMAPITRRLSGVWRVAMLALGELALLTGPAMAVPAAQSTFHQECTTPYPPDISTTGLASFPIGCTIPTSGDPAPAGATFSGTARTFVAPDGPVATTDVTKTSGVGVAVFGVSLLYYVGINQIATPPFMPSGIPVTFGISVGVLGENEGAGLVVGIATSRVDGFSNVSGDLYLEIDETATNLDLFLGNSGDVLYDPSEGPAIARVFLTTLCGGGGGGIPGPAAHITCTADPLIGFDQAAFDALEGSKTFPLAQYFAFVFSEGLAAPSPSPVPAPSTLLLVAAPLLGLIARRASKRR
jgi:hypothetical protein